MNELRNYLYALPTGIIEITDELLGLLTKNWDKFEYSDDTSMKAEKLKDRIKEPIWNPPNLTFNIERHGITVKGSKRAEIQQWTLDIDNFKAEQEIIKRRQIEPSAPRLNLDPIVEEIRQLILKKKIDPRLKWDNAGGVTVRVAQIKEFGYSPKPTVEGRRKRFREKLSTLLKKDGWENIRGNYYVPINN